MVLAPEPISLVDQSQSEQGEPLNGRISGSVVWAKDAVITNYETVQGATKAGAYVVWVIHIQKLAGGSMTICRRYSEFVTFRQKLVNAFPKRIREIPELPPKSLIARFRPDFLESRRQGLQYFLLCVLLNPDLGSSECVRDFVREDH